MTLEELDALLDELLGALGVDIVDIDSTSKNGKKFMNNLVKFSSIIISKRFRNWVAQELKPRVGERIRLEKKKTGRISRFKKVQQ